MSKNLPLVVILGATACGKSRLAIELSKRFSGEIISADSMQVYYGLDIATNKVTEEEQKEVKHHMINIVDPLQRFSVVDFRNKSLATIEDLLKKNSLPVVVGGTNYYIESIVWKGFIFGPSQTKNCFLNNESTYNDATTDSERKPTLIDSEANFLNKLDDKLLHTEEDFLEVEKFLKKPIYNDAFPNITSERLWRILEQVDPEAAHIYHPNDKRRIIRCLQIIQERRKNYTELLKNVNISSEQGKTSLGGPLRYSPTCVLWLSCESEILDKVLNERVDQMLQRGLLPELEAFHEHYNRERVSQNSGEKADYEKGIFQTIGFKEFHDYLTMDQETRKTDEGKKVLEKSIEEMKLSTRQYAKRQIKWIRRRFLQSEGTRDLPIVFKLGVGFNEKEWQKQVEEPAIEIVDSLISGRTLSDKLLELKQEPEKQSVINNPAKFYCEICDRTFIGTHYIEEHLKSRRHERRATKARHKKQLEEAEANKT